MMIIKLLCGLVFFDDVAKEFLLYFKYNYFNSDRNLIPSIVDMGIVLARTLF